MKVLTRAEIVAALPLIADGLAKYLYVSRCLRRPRFHADPDFQRAFNHLYRVRRGKTWRTQYFRLMGQARRRTISFKSAVSILLRSTGRYEASFTSKLIATIDPWQPVIDSVVLRRLGLRLPRKRFVRRVHAIDKIHRKLAHSYSSFLRTTDGRFLIRSFKRKYPHARITSIKMVDFVVWQTR